MYGFIRMDILNERNNYWNEINIEKDDLNMKVTSTRIQNVLDKNVSYNTIEFHFLY